MKLIIDYPLILLSFLLSTGAPDRHACIIIFGLGDFTPLLVDCKAAAVELQQAVYYEVPFTRQLLT
jgi:hypothetical protein